MFVISSAELELQSKISSFLCLPHACPCRPLLKKQQNSLFDYLISVLFLLAYENEDQLLWDPNILPEREVEEFLYRAVKRQWDELSASSLPEGEVVKDNEQVSSGPSCSPHRPRWCWPNSATFPTVVTVRSDSCDPRG